MNPLLKIVLEILGSGVVLGAMYKLRRSGCLIKKKPNSCDCAIQADLDGDGKTDVNIRVSDADSPTSSDIKEDHFRNDTCGQAHMCASDTCAVSTARCVNEKKI